MDWWTDFVIKPLWLLFPLVIGGILHMVAVKMDILPWFRRPIHLPSFGKNKTYRGLVLMPLFCVIGTALASYLEGWASPEKVVGFQQVSWIWLGIWLGLAYIFSELPNSYMKRRLGIGEGNLPENNKWIFVIIDQADSALGCLPVYFFFLDVPVRVLVACVVLGTGVHLLFNYLLFVAGIRKRPC